MKIIFMGTPDFSVPCLKSAAAYGDVAAVFTQPDKPVGRKQILTPPPVKTCALEYGFDVFQPRTLREDDTLELIKSINPDIIIVVAYGKILPADIISYPRYGCVNVHASLLPKYRGAAPIQRAVINGEHTTGVTVMQMDEGIDTGDIILTRETQIGENETSGELFDRLADMGADALSDALVLIENGKAERKKQPDGDFVYAAKVDRSMSNIDWNAPAQEVHNLVRGLQPQPCAETYIGGKRYKIHKTVLSQDAGEKPGEAVCKRDSISVCCGDGRCVEILELQADGKKKTDAHSFLLGNKIQDGILLGE